MAPWDPPKPMALAAVTLHPDYPGVIEITDQQGANWHARQVDNGTIELGRTYQVYDRATQATVHLFWPFAPHTPPSLIKVELPSAPGGQ